MSADIIQLDRVLAHYGPQAKEARDLERSVVVDELNTIWADWAFRSEKLDSRTLKAEADHFYEDIQTLSPRDNFQQLLQAQALQISAELGRLRSLLLEQTVGSIPMPFPGGADFLARHDFRELWSLRAPQLDCRCSPVRLRLIRCGRDFPVLEPSGFQWDIQSALSTYWISLSKARVVSFALLAVLWIGHARDLLRESVR